MLLHNMFWVLINQFTKLLSMQIFIPMGKSYILNLELYLTISFVTHRVDAQDSGAKAPNFDDDNGGC